ncbi:hypothetical protein FACS1894216_15150 [Synergistales bacterium]|nr:hypothetical protein FACS1894216_15150 [Synergistales bacterium]
MNVYDELSYAISVGDTKKVSLLIKNEVNIKKENGRTFLMDAAIKNDPDVIYALLRDGGDVDAKDNGGWTALMYAVKNNNLDAISSLLRCGADVNAKSNSGLTALMYAALENNPGAVSALLRNGADVNVKSNRGWTALNYAAKKNDLDVISALLKGGADVDATSMEVPMPTLDSDDEAESGAERELSTSTFRGEGTDKITLTGRIPWSLEEAALLIDAYPEWSEKSSQDAMTFANIVSDMLRTLAVNKDCLINETYRHISGVDLQFRSAMTLFTDGKKGLPNPPQILQKAYALYQEDRPQFDEIVLHAKNIIGEKMNIPASANTLVETIGYDSEEDMPPPIPPLPVNVGDYKFETPPANQTMMQTRVLTADLSENSDISHAQQLSTQSENSTEGINPPTVSDYNAEDTEQTFKNFMLQRGRAEGTANFYLGILKFKLVDTLRLNGKMCTNLFEYRTAADFEPVNTLIRSLPNFLEINKANQRYFSTVLNAYNEFLKADDKCETSSANQAMTQASVVIADLPENSNVSFVQQLPTQPENSTEEINTLTASTSDADLSYYKVFNLELFESYKNFSVQELNFSARTSNCLRQGNYMTVWDLLNRSENDLMSLPNFGKTSLRDVVDKIKKLKDNDPHKPTSLLSGFEAPGRITILQKLFDEVAPEQLQTHVYPLIMALSSKKRKILLSYCKTAECEYVWQIKECFDRVAEDDELYTSVSSFLYSLKNSVGTIIAGILMDAFNKESELQILARRANGDTLEAAGKAVGLTRERIRQVEKKAQNRFDITNNRNRLLWSICDVKEGKLVISDEAALYDDASDMKIFRYMLRQSNSNYYTYDTDSQIFLLHKDHKDDGKDEYNVYGNTVNMPGVKPYIEKIVDATTRSSICAVLEERFLNGIRPMSPIDIGKLKNAYLDRTGGALTISDSDITALLAITGIQHNDKVFVISDIGKSALTDLITDLIAEGNSLFYYEELYDKHAELIQEIHVFSAELLKNVLCEIFPHMRFSPKHFATENGITAETEVLSCFEADVCLTFEQVKAKLPYVPLGRIKVILGNNHNFVWVKDNLYTHVSNFVWDYAELDKIKRQVAEELSYRGYFSTNSLDVDALLELNPEFSEVAVRTALFYVALSDRYEKRGIIITKKGVNLDSVAIFNDFCQSREHLTLQELSDFEKEINGGGNSQALSIAYDVMFRVDKDNFVDQIEFDVERTDRALALFCTGDFIPIQAVTSFASFPYIDGYPWNLFLLESYCRRASKEFSFQCLVANSQNSGAIFRKSAGFSDYVIIMANAVINEDIELTEKAVADFLFESGYRASRRMDSVVRVIAEAQKIREGRV